MEKFKKIDKEFLVTDSSVNVYGFRLLTGGYMLQEFEKNPIGYYMHVRDTGVVVRWEDFRVDGDSVYAKPVINLSNSRGQQTVDEIENGFLNAASVGHIMALEYSDDPALLLPGQTGPTVTKWYNRELSLVDIPGNTNALAQLYDKDDNPINLADFSNKIPNMKTIVFTAAMLAAMKLTAESDQTAVETSFSDLVAKAAKVDTLQKQLDDLKAEQSKKEVKSLLDKALDVDKKITKELSDQLEVQFKDNPTGLQNLLAAMPAYKSVTKEIEDKTEVTKDLAAKSWDELFAAGQLEDLKAKNPTLFKQKFTEAFGHEPTM